MPCGDLMRIRLRHALPAAGAAVVAAVAAVVLVPGADAAITASPLVNPVSGKCLSVSGGGSANGTQVVIWTCTGGANRAWTSTAASELRVTIGGVTKCLDASGGGTASGTKLVIWTCTGRASQKWKLNTNRTITGTPAGKCVDINRNGTANGTIVQLWTCKTASNNNQRWTVGGGTLPPSPSRSASLTLTPFCTGGPAFLPAPAVFGFVTVPVRPLPRARDRCSALSSSSSTRSSSISSSSSSSSSARASSSTTSSRRSSTASSPRRFRLATSRPLPSNLRIVSRGSNAWPRLPRLPRRLRPALEWPARCGRPVREPVEPSAQGRQDSNLQPAVLETAALPIAPHPCAGIELPPRARRGRGPNTPRATSVRVTAPLSQPPCNRMLRAHRVGPLPGLPCRRTSSFGAPKHGARLGEHLLPVTGGRDVQLDVP